MEGCLSHIAISAYAKVEARGFFLDYELEDWLVVETNKIMVTVPMIPKYLKH